MPRLIKTITRLCENIAVGVFVSSLYTALTNQDVVGCYTNQLLILASVVLMIQVQL